MLHSITQNPYSPNPMHYLQLSFLDSSVKHTAVRTFVCKGSMLSVIADFASNTKVSSQCPTARSVRTFLYNSFNIIQNQPF
ncbi:hypothetical protein ACJZL1_06445 [Wolbachia endosymbiont of Rhagoletis indifferens]|uniref:hypothetical protein n=1 Tax=Wolbachia endosymbiont of Rhagoletis indifferens TaxID=3383250 RepID=UPI003AF345E1